MTSYWQKILAIVLLGGAFALVFWLAITKRPSHRPIEIDPPSYDVKFGNTILTFAPRTGPPEVAVWADFQANGSGYSETESTSGSAKLHTVHVESEDGRFVGWQYTVGGKGKPNSMIINNATYDLVNGALFLVRTTNGRTTITQLKVDVGKTNFRTNTLSELSKRFPEIGRFLREADGE
jgi:hypothetical protein